MRAQTRIGYIPLATVPEPIIQIYLRINLIKITFYSTKITTNKYSKIHTQIGIVNSKQTQQNEEIKSKTMATMTMAPECEKER